MKMFTDIDSKDGALTGSEGWGGLDWKDGSCSSLVASVSENEYFNRGQ